MNVKQLSDTEWECDNGTNDFHISKSEDGFIVDVFNEDGHVESIECDLFDESTDTCKDYI